LVLGLLGDFQLKPELEGFLVAIEWEWVFWLPLWSPLTTLLGNSKILDF
jgi:hypothetical protein